MAKKLYMAPSLLLGPLDPGGDEEEQMEYSQDGSGKPIDPNNPTGSGTQSLESIDNQLNIVIGE